MERGFYEKARADKTLRQEFLDSVDMGEYGDFVENITYRGKSEEGDYMEVDTLFNQAAETKSNLFVYDAAFDHFNANGFYNSLVHHEGFHLKDVFFNPFTVDTRIENDEDRKKESLKIFKRICSGEIGAYKNQISHPSFDNCSVGFRNFCYENLEEQILNFRNLKAGKGIDLQIR